MNTSQTNRTVMARTLVGNKSVLVTGATGTVGAALSKRLLEFGVDRLRALDNDEASLFFFEQQHVDGPAVSRKWWKFEDGVISG